MNRFRHVLSVVSLSFMVLLIVSSCKEKKVEKMPSPEITVVEVQQKDVPIYETFVGQVYGFSDIPIRARVTGFLTGIYFEEGRKVKKGQLLYTIDPQEYEAKVATQRSHLAEAKTGLAKAESDLNRIKPLAEINAVSKSDLDAAQAEYDAARSYVLAMQSNLEFAQINLGYCWIKSPIGGTIGKTKARIGEFVGQDPNPVILNTVSTTDSMRIEFFLTEAEYLRLARELKGHYQKESVNQADLDKKDPRNNVSLILADGSTFAYKGSITFINREIDPQTGSLLVQAAFPNPNRLLKPGQYAKVVIQINKAKGAILIPQRCLMELQGQYSVYVVSGDTVQSRQVKLGERVGDLQIITEGLKSGEKVVIDALQRVGGGMAVKPKLIEFKSKSKTQD